MGLSNYIPSSRISQSGVCTSTTRPASPYEGQMVYETDTNRVLVWDNAAWVMIADTDAPPGLQKIKPTSVSGTGASISGSDVVVSSGGANFTVNGVFSDDFRNYKIVVSDFRASAAAGVRLSMGTSASGSAYKWAQVYVNSTGTVAGSGSGGSSYWDCPIVSRGTTDSAGGEINVFSPNQTIETSWTCLGNDSDNGAILRYASGRLLDNTSYTDCFFSCFANYTAITVSFYGLR